MRGEGKVIWAFLVVGVGAALLKRSKPLSDYIGDQLIRAGEYFKAPTPEPAMAGAAPAPTEQLATEPGLSFEPNYEEEPESGSDPGSFI